MPFKLEFQSLKGLDKNKRAEKFSIAVNLAERCVNSSEFENIFLSSEFTQKGERSKLTNQELLYLCRQTVFLNYYVVPRPFWKRWSSVIGWTVIKETFFGPTGLTGIGSISTYEDKFDQMSVAELASHITHEAVHCPPARFEHYFNWSKERDMSLPYRIGAIVFNWVSNNLNK